jgi:two-component system sporulation sensor kinase B
MILLVMLFIMWSIALLFLFMRSKDKTNLWFSGLFFVQGLGVLEAIVEVLIIPRALENVQVFWVIRRFLATFCFRFFPYCLIMAGVSYADYFNFKMKRQLKFLFLIPLIITFILDFAFAKDGFLYTDLPQSRNYWMTHIWAVPYYLFSNYLFFQTYYVESEKQKKQQKFLVFIALALPTLMIMTGTLTIAPNNDWWKYLLVQSFLLTGVFLYFIGRYGLDGLRLRLEREYRNGTISGATIISHTVKNELSKIHCNIEAVKSGLCNADRALSNIDMAAEHMYEIVDRIGRHLQEFSLKCSNHSLIAIIDPLLASHENIFKEKNIHIVKNYNADPVIYCDKAHITEVLNNIIINAIEAITADNGRIFVELSSNKKQAVIKISDNGVGIPVDKLAVVSNLFYSTKGEGTGIRGSGLYYCAAVIERHQGELKISSEPDIGTTVDIILPLSRVTKKFA